LSKTTGEIPVDLLRSARAPWPMGSKAGNSRFHSAARVAALIGAISLALALNALLRSSCGASWSVECISLSASALIAAWCLVAAMRWSGRSPPPPGCTPSQWNISATLQLLRASLSGAAVAALGWSALVGERHLALMIAMQANTTIGAWLVCELQRRSDSRKSTTPTPEVSITGPRASRNLSQTLPRGWRYHKSSGLFEHKRTGRTQRDPPGTGESGSPLCNNLPPCDEENTLLDEEWASDLSLSDSDGAKRWRSRTWNDSGKRDRHKDRGGMSLWELRALMGGEADGREDGRAHDEVRGHDGGQCREEVRGGHEEGWGREEGRSRPYDSWDGRAYESRGSYDYRSHDCRPHDRTSYDSRSFNSKQYDSGVRRVSSPQPRCMRDGTRDARDAV